MMSKCSGINTAVHEFHYFSFPLLSNHGGAEQRRPGDVLLHRPAAAEVQGAGEDQGEAGGEASIDVFASTSNVPSPRITI